jgi:alpha-glucosidase
MAIWPNFMTCEAVMGLEYSKGGPRPTPQHNVTLPFTRMLAGPMDYTPGAFDLDGAEGYPKYVQTTRAQQIAMYIVFFSPLQMLVDYPAAYLSAPDQWEFVKKIPTSWDQTLFLDGYPGDFVAIARLQGKSWYVGFMTDEDPREIEIQLDFLDSDGDYTAHVVRDGDNAGQDPQSTVYETAVVKKGDRWIARLAGAGGQAVRFDPN